MHRNRLFRRGLVFSLALISFFGLRAQQWTASSPGDLVHITLRLQSGALQYCVLLEEDTVIRWSPLGLSLDKADFARGLRAVDFREREIAENYTMITGKRKEQDAHGQEAIVRFRNAAGQPLEVHLRAYDQGAAFRYRLPEIQGPATVEQEHTGFALPPGRAWLQSYSLPSIVRPCYEERYGNAEPIGTPAPDSSGYSLAALFETGGNWTLITEANLDSNYFGAHLAPDCEGGLYRVAHPLWGEAAGLYTAKAQVDGPFATPWRLILTGRSPAVFIESDLVHHLSAPSVVKDLSWIRPGRSSWSWWSDPPSSKDFQKLKQYVDLAATMGWEYSLVDANWNIMEGGNIDQLIAYAHQKNVGLTLWYNSAGPHCAITEQPRDRMHDPVARRAEFARLKKQGVKAVKVDFFNSDKQEIIRLYHQIFQDAADAGIMVICHGSTLPRGWSRTYPNLLALESVRGAEFYGFDSTMAPHAPAQNTILPFSRNAVGPMDYTPVTFTDRKRGRHLTTNAHELALAVVFESGMLHLADAASVYLATKGETRRFLREIPVTWDDTRYISGTPGSHLVIARRHGDRWYVAGINGENRAKTFQPDLSFLPGGAYTLTILSDGAHDREILEQQRTFKPGDSLEINTLPAGGFVLMLEP